MDANKQFESLNWGDDTISGEELKEIQGIDNKNLKSKEL